MKHQLIFIFVPADDYFYRAVLGARFRYFCAVRERHLHVDQGHANQLIGDAFDAWEAAVVAYNERQSLSGNAGNHPICRSWIVMPIYVHTLA